MRELTRGEAHGIYGGAMMTGPYNPLRITLVAVAVFGVGYVLAGADGWGPPAANESAIGEVSRWCERVAGGLLREPVNTLGNLGFVAAGLAMFAVLGRDEERARPRVNRFVGHQPIALLYAGATVFLGPGSMVMHGTHTRFGAWLDNVSMIAFILIPWLTNLAMLGRWRSRTLFATYGVVLAAYAAGYWFVGPDLGIGLDLFGASIAIWVVSEVLVRWWSPAARWWSGLAGFVVAVVFGITPGDILADLGSYWWVVGFWLPGLLATHPPNVTRRAWPWFWVGVASFVGAYAIWLTGTADHARCRPDSLVQPHAIWHLLGALATWAFFQYLRTGRPAEVQTFAAAKRPATAQSPVTNP